MCGRTKSAKFAGSIAISGGVKLACLAYTDDQLASLSLDVDFTE